MVQTEIQQAQGNINTFFFWWMNGQLEPLWPLSSQKCYKFQYLSSLYVLKWASFVLWCISVSFIVQSADSESEPRLFFQLLARTQMLSLFLDA